MASGTGSVGRTKDGVPIWDGDPGSYNEFAEAVRLYEQGTAYHKRPQVGPRVAAELTGAARRFISGQPANWLSYQGGTEALLEHLRQGFGKPRVAEVTEHLSKFFKYCKRKPGESINEYVARRAEVYLRAQQAMARLPQTATKARSTSRSGYTTPTWNAQPTTWSRRTSAETVAEEEHETEGAEAPVEETGSQWDNWSWNSEPWWASGWGSMWSQWGSDYGSSWQGSGSWSAPRELPEILPDFIQGWLLLQDAGLDAQERGLVLTTAGEDFRVATISNALRAHFPDGDLKRRDGGRRQHGFLGSVEEEETEGEDAAASEEAEVAENLTDEGFAMWSGAQNDIAEALAAIGGSITGQLPKVLERALRRAGHQMICLGCGKKGHRVANCPNPQAANLAENETASFICFSEHLEEKPGLQEAPIGIDFQEDVMENQVTPQETNSMETEIAAFLQDDDHEAVDGEAYATGITTHQAVQQGAGAADGSQYGDLYGDPRVLEVDQQNRPVFGFGNSSMDKCTSTVKMGLQAGRRSGAIQVHALDKGDGPILLSIVEAMTTLGAVVDFRSNLAVFRNLDTKKLVPLERSATGHMLVPLSGDLYHKAKAAVQEVPGKERSEFYQFPEKQRVLAMTMKPISAKMIEQEGETAPRQWTRVELLQRVEEITGNDPTREKGKKKEEESEQFCADRLGMQVNYNLTIAQLQKDAMAVIASKTPPEPSDLVGFGRHASLSYARLQSDHPEYCRWVKEAQKEIRHPHKNSDMKGTISGGYPTLQEPRSPRSSTAASTKPQPGRKETETEEEGVRIPSSQLAALVDTIELMKEEILVLKGERPRKKTTSEEPDVTSVMRQLVKSGWKIACVQGDDPTRETQATEPKVNQVGMTSTLAHGDEASGMNQGEDGEEVSLEEFEAFMSDTETQDVEAQAQQLLQEKDYRQDKCTELLKKLPFKPVRYLNKFLENWSGGPFCRSSLVISWNNLLPLHRDVNNDSRYPNHLIGLGDYKHGELWLQSLESREDNRDLRRQLPTGDWIRGRLWDVKGKVVKFSPKQWHQTQKWSGERITVTAFVSRGVHHLSPSERERAKSCGFVLPPPEPAARLTSHGEALTAESQQRIEEERIMKQLYLLHSATGHGSVKTMIDALKRRGASQRVLDIASRFVCSACQERKRPPPRRLASLEVLPPRWQTITADVGHWTHPRSGETVQFMLVIDEGSRFRIAKVLSKGSRQQPSAATCLAFLRESWFQVFGRPDVLRLDPAGSFRGQQVEDFCDRHSVYLDVIAADAHWQIGVCENAIKGIKHVMERLCACDEQLITEEALALAIEVFNSREQVRGFTPIQHAFGRNPDVTGRLISRPEQIPEEALVENAHDDFARQAQMRADAEKAMCDWQAKQRISRAMHSRSRPQVTYRPGDLVYFWRTQESGKSRRAPGTSHGRFLGPARILAMEGRREPDGSQRPGSAVWLVRGRSLLKCSPEQLRPASPREELLESLASSTPGGGTPWTFNRLAEEIGGNRFEDISGERPTPPEWHRAQNPAEEAPPPRFRVRGKRASPEEAEDVELEPNEQEAEPSQPSRPSRPRLAGQGHVLEDAQAAWWATIPEERFPTCSSFWADPRAAVEVAIDLPENQRNLHNAVKNLSGYFVSALKRRAVEVSEKRLSEGDKELFREAKAVEVKNFVASRAFEALPPETQPDRTQAMGMRWILTWKTREDGTQKAKARAVLLGYQDTSYAHSYESSPGSAVRLRKACCGLVDAPLEWYRTVSEFFVAQGMERCWSDACMWVLRKEGRLIGVVSGHVDDFLFSGDEQAVEWKQLVQAIQERFRWGDWDKDNFVQCGVQVTREGNCFKLSQPAYVESIPEIPVNSHRRKYEKDSPTTPQEKSKLRGLLGAISWHAQQGHRIDLMAVERAERKSNLELLSVKEAQIRTELQVRWVHSEAQLGNSLTKQNGGHELELFYKMGQAWRIVEDPAMRSARKRKADGVPPLAGQTKEGMADSEESELISMGLFQDHLE
ncbi:unnamed protein product [Symbiodinium sp. KB8]|nr:unnamed protein product [Symbiodinium sp. KB8]